MATGPYGSVGYTMSYAQTMALISIQYANGLQSLAASFTPQIITPIFPDGPSAPPLSLPSVPTLQPITWTMPAQPGVFNGSLTVDDIMPDPFDDQPPVLSFPAAPTPSYGLTPDAPPIDTNFAYPTLSVTLPNSPSLLTLDTVTFDGITMPTIDPNVPTLTAAEPSVLHYLPGQNYTSALLDAVRATLLERIQSGTNTGLPPDAEQGIYDRAREREARSLADNEAALDRLESLGYKFAPGTFLDAMTKLRTEFGYTSASISRDIMIKQAELVQKNIQHAIDATNTLEGSYLTYVNQVEQRAFESVKYETASYIEIYNAKVRAYAAYLDAYKTKVAIYEAQIRGELAKLEAYKAQLDAERTKATINQTLVEEYKTMVEAANINVNIYREQINAIRSKAEIEKLKIEIYGEQIRGYVANVSAFTAQTEAFKAQVGAEATKQEAYKARVQSYAAQVEAAVKTIEARIEEFKGLIQANLAQWEGYKAAVSGESSKAQAIAANNTSLTDSYRAEVSGLSAYNETLTKQWQAALDQAQRVSDIGINAAKANAELAISARSLQMDAAKVGAQVSAQLGAAAMNAINWSNSFSESFSESTSASTSASTSVNTTTTISQGG